MDWQHVRGWCSWSSKGWLLELAPDDCSYTLRGELYSPRGRRLFDIGFVASACVFAFLEF